MPSERIADHPSLLPRLRRAPSSEIASVVGLRYTTDETPGIRREKRGKTFVYFDARGLRLTDERTLRRVRALAVPPAYRDVWICPDPRGHLQATGRDGRGRKQYRYHARWREVRDAVKFHRMIAFAGALPKIRAAIDRDLARRGLPREKVLAAVVRLLERTRVRVGNEEYAKANESFGLTTLRNEHAKVFGAHTIRFEFVGKSNKRHCVEIDDARLATIVRACLEIPGQELFQYLDARGRRRTVRSNDVNDHVRSIAGGDFTAKDFRTWSATVHAAELLRACATRRRATSKREVRTAITATIATVADALRNTPAVCKKSYVHPAVLEAFGQGWLADVTGGRLRAASRHGLSEPERFTLSLLRTSMRREREKPSLRRALERSIETPKRRAA